MTVKITFNEDCVVHDCYEGTDKAAVFKKGKTYDMEDASAERWLRRGLAEAGGHKAWKKIRAARAAEAAA